MPVKRERTSSVFEEKNVTEFVEATRGYKSNVSFHSASEATAEGTTTVLLLGTASQLAASEVESLPFFGAEVAAAIKVADENSIYATTVGGRRVLVGVVPTVASRHNCAVRPDAITSLVEKALTDPHAKTALDVYTRSQEVLAVAGAVARGANKKFSAKKGLAEKSYVAAGAAVRVFFPVDITSRRAALQATADSVQLCQRLVDAPTNLLDTTTFTEIASLYAEELKFDVKVIRGEELREQGYGGLYGVGKAAEFPPALVVLSYKPNGSILPKQKIAFVGKGIVYDTGGLAIKTPATFMCGMKSDMGGAAAVFASFVAAVRMQVDSELACVLCLADNAIGPRSQRNDDIVRLKSGVTVEINNTDAEGRLVLSDGVYHASSALSFVPDVIVDMATLTGAQGIATGQAHAAIYSNSGQYETMVVEAGRKCGDVCHPVVYCPEFHNPEFASKVADYKNSVANRSNAQVSCAGQFIGNNLASNFTGAWVHVDLASPAVKDGRATGYGILLNLQTFFGARFE